MLLRPVVPNFLKMAVFGLVLMAMPSLAQVDSVFHKPDSLLALSQHKLDSISDKPSAVVDSINQITAKLQQATDTLAPDVTKYNQKLDSITARLQFKIDSLTQLGQPTGHLTQLRDSLNQLGPIKTLNEANAKLQRFEQKVNEPFNKVESKINEKLNLMRQEGGSEAGVPGDLDLPGVSKGGVNGPDLGLPGGEGQNPLGKTQLPSSQLNGINDPLKDITSFPQQQMDKLNDIEAVDKAGKVLDGAKSATVQIEAYSQDAQNIATGNFEKVEQLPETLESQMTRIDDVAVMQKEMGGVDEMKEMLGKGNDPEALKKEAASQATKAAVDHFAGKGDQLKAAMAQVSKLKLKYSKLNSLKDIPKRPPNPMKNKPFVERLVPGLGLQFQYSERLLIDFNPYVGYRITGRWTAGGGWVERVAFGKKLKTYGEERFYGPRVYGQFGIGKGFSAYASLETLYGLVPPVLLNANPGEGIEKWVWSAFVGLKKNYQFVKGVKGNFQFLYNVYDDHNQSPYADRLVVRMGFEFQLKKKRKSVHPKE